MAKLMTLLLLCFRALSLIWCLVFLPSIASSFKFVRLFGEVCSGYEQNIIAFDLKSNYLWKPHFQWLRFQERHNCYKLWSFNILFVYIFIQFWPKAYSLLIQDFLRALKTVLWIVKYNIILNQKVFFIEFNLKVE